MGYRYFDDQRLWDLTVEVFTRNGYSRSDCEDIANVLLASDRMGIESHGVQRMKLYTHSLEIGRIKRGAKSEIVRETPVSAVIDAHDAIGQPVSVAAMQMAIDKAKKAGVGIVVVRDSNHYGIAGYYAKMAADQGLLGISMTNTEALVVPTFGKQPMMGTNPIAVSMPGTPHPFHLDMATSVVPAGKMEVYAKAGKTLPGDWLMNSDGSPSYDPNDFLRIRATKSLGGIFPVGGEGETNSGHKGYGLSLLECRQGLPFLHGRRLFHLRRQGADGKALQPVPRGHPQFCAGRRPDPHLHARRQGLCPHGARGGGGREGQ